MNVIDLTLQERVTNAAAVRQPEPGTWRLEISPGSGGSYRLAQLDDYTPLPRHLLRWRPPFQLSLRARASQAALPGTWGFGLWNDPFSFQMGIGGVARRLPSLPNTAWFFFASPPNYLSFRDDLPAQGFLAATFRSPHLPSLLLGMASPLALLALLPPVAGLGRLLARRLVRQDAASLSVHPADWHHYSLEWQASGVRFLVDEQVVTETGVSPRGPLGLVLWVDNQYAALPPGKGVRLGTLPNPATAWIEIADLQAAQTL